METQLDQNAVDVTVTCQGRCGNTIVDEIYFLEDVFNVFNCSKPISFRECRRSALTRSPQKEAFSAEKTVEVKQQLLLT